MHYVRVLGYREIECKKKSFRFGNTENRFEAFKECIWNSKEKDKVVLGMKPTRYRWFDLE